MKYWYVLLVKTGCENKVRDILNKRLDNKYYLAFIPTRTYVYRRKNSSHLKTKICFPGYVFVESIYDEENFYVKASVVVRTIAEAFCFLNYGRKIDIAMKKEEVEGLKQLLGESFCIGPSMGVIREGQLVVVRGNMKGMEAKVIKVNRHNREAIIEIDVLNEKKRIAVMLEVYKKDK